MVLATPVSDGLTDHTRQTPPDCRPDDDRTAEQEQADSVPPQGRVDIFHSQVRLVARRCPGRGQDRLTIAAIPSIEPIEDGSGADDGFLNGGCGIACAGQ